MPNAAHNNNMSDLLNLFRREKAAMSPMHGVSRRTRENKRAGSRRHIRRLLGLPVAQYPPRSVGREDAFVCWLDGVASGGGISRDVLRPLTELLRAGVALSPERLLDGAVYSSQAALRTTLDETVSDITQGCCAVVFEDEGCAVCFELRSAQIQRGISEPTMEKSLKGGKDSFTETLRTDTALVRKRIANPALKIKALFSAARV